MVYTPSNMLRKSLEVKTAKSGTRVLRGLPSPGLRRGDGLPHFLRVLKSKHFVEEVT